MSSTSMMMLSVLVVIMVVPFLVSCTEFEVGGDLGWTQPPKNDLEVYNEWAGHQRFHVGDTIYFKYKKDSVLVVNEYDYENCVDSNPISKFTDGHTNYELEHAGLYYFISGQPGHCKAGQKMAIRVMVQSKEERPKDSPREGGHHDWDSDDFGPPGFNATTRLSVATCFMTALVAMFIVAYLFIEN